MTDLHTQSHIQDTRQTCEALLVSTQCGISGRPLTVPTPGEPTGIFLETQPGAAKEGHSIDHDHFSSLPCAFPRVLVTLTSSLFLLSTTPDEGAHISQSCVDQVELIWGNALLQSQR